MKKLRIAQVSPLWESVPPLRYGGAERIVAYLTEMLVQLGHDVTLYASGDSVTSARLVPVYPEALRHRVNPLDSGAFNPHAPLVTLLERVFDTARSFDVIHSHVDFFAFPLIRRCPVPVLTTLHGQGRADQPDVQTIYREFSDVPVVTISDAQRRILSPPGWRATVHHGLPLDLYTFRPGPGRYLAFVGRIAPEKCLDHAIELAKRSVVPLRVAAKVDPVDLDYFQRVIAPLMAHPLIEYLGELSDEGKNDLLGHAAALVCPTYDWPEPFGLVVIEALACGTPVLAYRRGAFPELIEDGVTGFVCEDLQEMEAAVGRLARIDRKRCRHAFETRFGAERMARQYVQIYEELIREARWAAVG